VIEIWSLDSGIKLEKKKKRKENCCRNYKKFTNYNEKYY